MTSATESTKNRLKRNGFYSEKLPVGPKGIKIMGSGELAGRQRSKETEE
jgi:hypothetical protein